jgi:hypothetical protein
MAERGLTAPQYAALARAAYARLDG